jgi:hypothetical protein
MIVAAAMPVAAASKAPIGVSPGLPEQVAVVGSFCPAFSWSVVPRAEGYELVVVELEGAGESGPAAEPLLQVRLPRGSGSWTPDGSRCLAEDTSYAWYVRALMPRGIGAWSEGLAFEVAPSAEVRRLELLLERLEELERRQAEAAGPPAVLMAPQPLSSPAVGVGPVGLGGSEAAARPTTTAAELTGDAGIRSEKLSSSAEEVYGVLGLTNSETNDAAGVAGENTATSGRTVGVMGVVSSDEGIGVVGYNAATTSSSTDEWAFGVQGTSLSPKGVGAVGVCEADSGQNAGVVGITRSASGWGGFFTNEDGGSLIGASNDPSDLGTLEFEVTNDGTVYTAGFLALKPFDGPATCDGTREGYVYFDDSINELCVCTGSSWVAVDGSGTCG